MKTSYKKLVEEVTSKNFCNRLIIMLFFEFLLALNYNTFLLPNHIVVGGTSGIAIIVNHFFGIESALFILLFNIVFIILSFFLLGPEETGKSIIGSIMYPLFVSLTTGLGLYLSKVLIFENFLLTIVVTAVIYGVCNGFIYKTGFFTGGIDILLKIISKYLKIPRGNASFGTNIFIILIGALVFGINKAAYAIIIIFFNSNLVDKIMLGISNNKTFYIRTHKSDEIKKIIGEMDSGYTVIQTQEKDDKHGEDMIMCVINTSDYYMFNNIIQSIDPNAFIIISDCYEVYGGQRKKKFPFI